MELFSHKMIFCLFNQLEIGRRDGSKQNETNEKLNIFAENRLNCKSNKQKQSQISSVKKSLQLDKFRCHSSIYSDQQARKENQTVNCSRVLCSFGKQFRLKTNDTAASKIIILYPWQRFHAKNFKDIFVGHPNEAILLLLLLFPFGGHINHDHTMYFILISVYSGRILQNCSQEKVYSPFALNFIK